MIFDMSNNPDALGSIHRDIMRRCYDEKYKLYKDYGARGRKVCEEWHDRDNFRLWAQSNGYEKGLRLLRRDTKGDFCPDNCFWGVSPTKSYEYGKIKAHKAEIKARKVVGIGFFDIGAHFLYCVVYFLQCAVIIPV